MKPILFLIFIIFLFTNCEKKTASKPTSKTIAIIEEKPIILNNVEVLKKELIHNPNKGKWYYNEKPFNGYSLKYFPNGILEEKRGYYNGKREGIARRWTKNNKLQVESYY